MSALDHVTSAHARRLARADLIGALAMLALLGGCFAMGMRRPGDAGTHVNERPMGILIGLVVLVPYSILLFISSGLLRRWPRTGYIAHVLARSWPFLLVLGAVLVAAL